MYKVGDILTNKEDLRFKIKITKIIESKDYYEIEFLTGFQGIGAKITAPISSVDELYRIITPLEEVLT